MEGTIQLLKEKCQVLSLKKILLHKKNNNHQLSAFAAQCLLLWNQTLADVILGNLSQTLAVTISMFLALLLFLCFIILKKISLLVFFFWQRNGCLSTEWTDSRWHSGSMHGSLPPATVRCNVTRISLCSTGLLWALRVYPHIKHLCWAPVLWPNPAKWVAQTGCDAGAKGKGCTRAGACVHIPAGPGLHHPCLHEGLQHETWTSRKKPNAKVKMLRKDHCACAQC